ncbi:oxidoreductase [Kocuria soli]|uniref:Oxidoreductase n=1 Tax=Kocuria soli TaxID=2485125 RepID=A0A3N3ZS21_9MICC|nr:FMN reductase [Kocuria soli]ROZ64253.1 oxidoreductase [Kocuria soli]
MTRHLVVVAAGLSNPSTTSLLGERLAEAVTAQVGGRGESVEVEYVELRDLAVNLAHAMTTGGLPDPVLDDVKRKLSAADGLIAVTPVFKASYAGLFKSFFDVLDQDALVDMPVLIAATAGTPRHSLVLDHAVRPLFTYMHATVLPTGVFAATEDFGSDEAGLERRINRAAGELATAMVSTQTGVAGFMQEGLGAAPAPTPTGRVRRTGVDMTPAVTDFTSLLRGHDGS